ncbi:nuclear transport factor 2 family protein [Oceanobacter mangrovi]|uniref:nuclear transport factor 2 family protein n=1 Tax=Oceanobacter mangrovi TaxID=2862510 RepID=UPI001C8ED0A1|nr:nuclear transport factor 2 family protein [Oceanobacter mangrovi]
MNTENQLQIERDCQRLILDAVHYVDNREFEAFADCFSREGKLFRPGQPQPLQGREAILAAYLSRPATRMTRHICTNMRVLPEADGRMRVTSYVLLHASGLSSATETTTATADQPAAVEVKVGEFDDLCVFEDGRWLIAERSARFVM